MDETTRKCVEAQWHYAIEHRALFFIPDDGVCFSCKKNIFQPTKWREGITIDEAASQLITGCPHCFRTYCD